MAKSRGGGRRRGRQKPIYAAMTALGIKPKYDKLPDREQGRYLFKQHAGPLMGQVPEGYVPVLQNASKGSTLTLRNSEFITQGGLVYSYKDVVKLQNAGFNIAVLSVK